MLHSWSTPRKISYILYCFKFTLVNTLLSFHHSLSFFTLLSFILDSLLSPQYLFLFVLSSLLYLDCLFILHCNDREWTEGTRVWVQYVSTTPATRLDIVSLQVLDIFSIAQHSILLHCTTLHYILLD